MRPSPMAFARDFFIEGIWRGVKRRVEADLIADLRSVRPSSFPLISGDGFRIASSLFFEHEEWEEAEQGFRQPIAFIDLTALEKLISTSNIRAVESVLKDRLSRLDSQPVVLLHNGDLLPPESVLRALELVSSHIYASNLLDESPHRTALPLGIENLCLNRNGRIHDFLATPHTNLTRVARSTRIFASFAVRNNEAIRGKLVEDLNRSRFNWQSQRITPSEHREQVSSSKFVLSPPGRGADCHRTWESIYLGAVPVVLKGYLAPSLLDSLPIYAVDSYREFLELTDSELDALYLGVRRKPTDIAFMPHWLAKIISSARQS